MSKRYHYNNSDEIHQSNMRLHEDAYNTGQKEYEDIPYAMKPFKVFTPFFVFFLFMAIITFLVLMFT